MFDRKKLKSLFDRGIVANLKVFVEYSLSKNDAKWIGYVSSKAHESVIGGELQSHRPMIL